MKNGVENYAHGSVETTIHFPNGEIACKWCHLYCRYEEAFKRYSCKLTGEWIPDPAHCIGGNCPLTFKEVQDEDKR